MNSTQTAAVIKSMLLDWSKLTPAQQEEACSKARRLADEAERRMAQTLRGVD